MSHITFFSSLPDGLRRRLLLGFSGKLHLHGIADEALSLSHDTNDIFASIAKSALLAAWGENPFDGYCVAKFVKNIDRLPQVPPSLFPFVKAIMQGWEPDLSPESQRALNGSPDEQLHYLLAKLQAGPMNTFWIHHLYEFCRIQGKWSPLKSWLQHSHIPFDDLGMYALANCFMGSAAPQDAVELYSRNTLMLPTRTSRLAAALARSGAVEQAIQLLRESVATEPWNTNLWLCLYDLIHKDFARSEYPKGLTCVLGYSWNKAHDLAHTLDSLFRSNLGNAFVRLIDNGSDDTTPDVLRQFVDKFGADKASVVTLPVNIGAPGARNWLKSLPEVQSADYVTYIDDDIELPRDWLQRLGGAAALYPDAGVWGCKVVDFGGPARVQCGEHNLLPTVAERQQGLMGTMMLQDGDFGQADYIRPCASVTGCTHLFRTERLMATGDFDIRFSPTQCDDLERDLRHVLQGGYAVYTGHLSLLHKRKSGALSDCGQPESGAAAANLYKLKALYSSENFEDMASVIDDVLAKDLQRKMTALERIVAS